MKNDEMIIVLFICLLFILMILSSVCFKSLRMKYLQKKNCIKVAIRSNILMFVSTLFLLCLTAILLYGGIEYLNILNIKNPPFTLFKFLGLLISVLIWFFSSFIIIYLLPWNIKFYLIFDEKRLSLKDCNNKNTIIINLHDQWQYKHFIGKSTLGSTANIVCIEQNGKDICFNFPCSFQDLKDNTLEQVNIPSVIGLNVGIAGKVIWERLKTNAKQ